MTFQAYIDDSGSEPQSQVFVLAGFISTHEKWAALSDEWQEALGLSPKLEYFKMSEAARMGGQFSERLGWNERLRDDRVITFARIAQKHTLTKICAWIRHDDFEKHIMSLPVPVRRLSSDNPYILLFMQVVLAAAVYGTQAGITEACDFIFDEQSDLGVEALQWWPNFKWITENSSKSDLPKYIGSPPIFRDEKTFLPLQAADLYAWQARNDYVRNNRVPNQSIVIPSTVAMQVLDQLPLIHRPYHTDEVIRLREHLLAVGKRYAENFPDIPLLPPIEDKRARRKAHRNARRATEPKEKGSE
jgi:hypothetical protein